METSKEKNPVTWAIVTEVVKLSKLQLRNIVKSTGLTDMPPESPVDDRLLIRVLLADMLERLVFLTAEQRALILAETDHAQELALVPDRLGQLAFADGRYCLWTGNLGFLDLETGDVINGLLPVPPMETISYNLNELYRRGKQQIEKRAEHYAKRQANEGAVDESANVREHSPDSVPG